jgi:N-acetylglutamate synthase-like GNAT family acetyltransferase
MTIRAATGPDVDAIRGLLREYAAWLNVDLCFQGFDEELAALPGEYAPPSGQLLVAETEGGEIAGCVALRRIDDEICEMKRLYVPERFRGSGLGRRLAEAILEEARAIGYRRIRLDTLPQMRSAQRLYEWLGFREIDAYRFNPVVGTRFLERDV